MKEVEVKILNVDQTKIIEVISNLGAEKIFDDKITTIFFDYADVRISRADSLLRLRQAGQKSTLTYKKIVSKEAVKEADEYEVEVSNLQTMQRILECLDLVERRSVEKHRTSYRLRNVRFDIDTFEGELDYIPTFLEIESESTDLIHKYAKLLGFRPVDCLPWSTEEVINHYQKEKPS